MTWLICKLFKSILHLGYHSWKSIFWCLGGSSFYRLMPVGGGGQEGVRAGGQTIGLVYKMG